MLRIKQGKKDKDNLAGFKQLEILSDKYVLKSSENYKGLSYSDLTIRWQRWLLSENPDDHQHGDIIFLRGSIGHHDNKKFFFESSVCVREGNGILVPIITTHYNIGEYYDGLQLKNEFQLRAAIREHVNAAGPFWAVMEIENNNSVVKLVPNIESYRVESMPFELDVSKNNPFLDKMDEPNYPGSYIAIVSGYFILLKNLPQSTYKIRFGGYGMDGFYTESLYKINVFSERSCVKDLSGLDFAPSLLSDKKVT